MSFSFVGGVAGSLRYRHGLLRSVRRGPVPRLTRIKVPARLRATRRCGVLVADQTVSCLLSEATAAPARRFVALPQRLRSKLRSQSDPVSYTHLTLPTSDLV